MKRTKEEQLARMLPIGSILYHTKAARFWHDGDTASFCLSWWNPVAWLFFILVVPAQIVMCGLNDIRWYELGIGISPYWKEHEREYF